MYCMTKNAGVATITCMITTARANSRRLFAILNWIRYSVAREDAEAMKKETEGEQREEGQGKTQKRLRKWREREDGLLPDFIAKEWCKAPFISINEYSVKPPVTLLQCRKIFVYG